MFLVTQGLLSADLVTQGYGTAVAPIPPTPTVTPAASTALAESSGARGGYLVPTQWGDANAEANRVLYPPGTGWLGAADGSAQRKVKERKRRWAIALVVASVIMDEDELL